MWGYIVLLLVGATYGQKLLHPPYVQSRTAFRQARLYLQESVPHENSDITDPEARKHFAFGIVTAVTGALAKNTSDGGNPNDLALAILDLFVPYAWENYNDVSNQVNQILAEANLKIQPITNLIDALCSTTDSVEECNALVDNKVNKSNDYVKNKAKLLLALGGVSRSLIRNKYELDSVAKAYNVVPYLLRMTATVPYINFVNDLADTYKLLRKNKLQ